jgi:predicted nuclease of predicted toxin-antitoxin system
VKLLYDENLSRRLLARLGDLYPDSEHVVPAGLEGADDRTIWAYAASRGLVIVTKDWDFVQLSSLLRHPPKVVWLRLGNCSTGNVAEVLRRRHLELLHFEGDESTALLIVSSR